MALAAAAFLFLVHGVGVTMTRAQDGVSGVGIGLRMGNSEALLAALPREVRWVEVHPENYIERGGRFARILERAREAWPVVTHGLTMCFGALEPCDPRYQRELRSFLRDLEVSWHSDHACFGSVDGVFAHDLLPLPFTDEAVAVVSQRISEAQDALGLPVALENVSYYAPMGADPLAEVDFLNEILSRTGAKLLLDVNNVYVNSQNFGFDARAWIDRVPADRVVQMHVAGHLVREDGLRIDTHGEPVPEGVYSLLEHTLRRTGDKPILLERDNNIPPLEEQLDELRRLAAIVERVRASALVGTSAGVTP